MKKPKKVTKLSDERRKRQKVREGSPVDITNRQLRDILNYGTDRNSNPYHRIMSSREISPRLLALCEQLIPRVTQAQDILNTTRKKLIERYSRLDGKKQPIMLPNELIVEQQLVEHFSKLAANDKTNNVAKLIQKEEVDKAREEIVARLPRDFWRYDVENQFELDDAFEEVLNQKADFGEMKKIVITKDDIPRPTFFNAFERAILSPLFEFDDLEEI